MMGSNGQQPLTHRNVVPSPMACSTKGNASAGLLTAVWTGQGLRSGCVHQRLILRQGTGIL